MNPEYTARCQRENICCTCGGALVRREVGIAIFVRSNGGIHGICGACKVSTSRKGLRESGI